MKNKFKLARAAMTLIALLLAFVQTVRAEVDPERVEVSYICEDGSTKPVDAILLTGSETELRADWYVVTSDINFDHKIEMYGEVNLILADNATMTVQRDGSYNGIEFRENLTKLTIYGQDRQTGELVVKNCGEAAIYGYASKTSLILNGGVITVDESYEGIVASYITINRGSVDIKTKGNSLLAYTELLISGGKISVESEGIAINCYSHCTINGGVISIVSYEKYEDIKAENITLGFSNADDQISFVVGTGCNAAETFVIADEQVLTDGDGNKYKGELDNSQQQALAGKTLKRAKDIFSVTFPYCLEIKNDVTFKDGNYVDADTKIEFALKSGFVLTSPVTMNGTTLTADEYGVYSVTVSSHITIEAEFSVQYIDADGSMQTISDFTLLTGSEDYLKKDGWYVVSGNVTFGETIGMSGKVNLILADGATMTVNPNDNRCDGIYLSNQLTIFGQEKQTGELVIKNCNYAIRNGEATPSFVQNGGVITMVEGVDASGIETTDITINRGTISVQSRFNAFDVNNNVIINGGTISVKSEYLNTITCKNNCSINGGSISITSATSSYHISAKNITLDFSNDDDQISFVGGNGCDEACTIADGQIFIDGAGHYAGVLSDEQQKALVDKTLRRAYSFSIPECMKITNGVTLVEGKYVAAGAEVKFELKSCFELTSDVMMNNNLLTANDGVYNVTVNSDVDIEADFEVPYIDVDGSKKAVKATLLTGSEEKLHAGWYAVTSDITFNHEIDMDGEVNLILADGAKMMVFPGKDYDGIDFGLSLAIYGQEKQTGELVIENCYDAMYFNEDESSFTQNGGSISITEGIDRYGIAASAGAITINRGTLNIKSASHALFSDNNGDIVVNGGNVTVETTSEGKYCMYAVNSITLGLSDNDIDQIKVSGGTGYCAKKSISIADGQVLIDGEANLYSGTLDETQIKALNNSTLKRSSDVVYAFILPNCMKITNDVTLINGKYAAPGTEVKFAAKDGYEVSNVQANYEALTADENGVYAVTISDADVEITLDVVTVLLDKGGLKIVEDKDNNKVAIFANSAAEIIIDETYVVDKVELLRTFTPDAKNNYSKVTMILPFAVKSGEYQGGTFYEFGGVSNESGVWTATMNIVTGNLAANTPYIFVPSDNQLVFTFTEKVELYKTQEIVSSTNSIDGWTFNGVYKRQEWGVEHGKHDYFFANRTTEARNGKIVNAGDFVKIGNMCGLNPMRCFLSYDDGTDESLLKSTIVLPESIEVRFVDEVASVVEPDGSLSDSDDDITTPISEINPASGTKVWSYDKTIYIESAPDTDYRIIDLSGRTLRASSTTSTREEVVLPGKTSDIVIVIINNKSFKISY